MTHTHKYTHTRTLALTHTHHTRAATHTRTQTMARGVRGRRVRAVLASWPLDIVRIGVLVIGANDGDLRKLLCVAPEPTYPADWAHPRPTSAPGRNGITPLPHLHRN